MKLYSKILNFIKIITPELLKKFMKILYQAQKNFKYYVQIAILEDP